MRKYFLKTGLADYVSAETGGSGKPTVGMMNNNTGPRAMLLAQVTTGKLRNWQRRRHGYGH